MKCGDTLKQSSLISMGLLKQILTQHLVSFGYERVFPGAEGKVVIEDVDFDGVDLAKALSKDSECLPFNINYKIEPEVEIFTFNG